MLFEDKFEPIKLELKNKKGEVFQLETLFLNSKDQKEIELILKSDKYETETERGLELLIKKIGKNQKFWEQFSQKVLLKVIRYLNEQNEIKVEKKTG
jgi:hypothetical protein